MEMETAVLLLVAAFAFLAILLLTAGWLWMMVVGFQTHPGWGFAVLLAYPWGSIAFAFTNWQRARWPAVLSIAGFVAMVALFLGIPVLESAGLVEWTPQPVATPSASPAP
jgi:hypothetical protein